MRALILQQHQRARLGHILISEGWASQNKVLAALSAQFDLPVVSLSGRNFNRRLLGRKPAAFWLEHCAIPWLHLGKRVVIAIAHPEDRARLEEGLRESFPQLSFVLAPEAEIRQTLAQHFRSDLASAASARPPNRLSCRSLMSTNRRSALCLFGFALILCGTFFPHLSLLVLTSAALVFMALFMSLRLIGVLLHLRRRKETAPVLPTHKQGLLRLPRISILVPMYQEADISRDLLRRLGKLSYPRTLIEVFLVLEDSDALTKSAVKKVELPHWIDVIEVPGSGGLKTKPRAMNYALDFCRGDIVGVWDAEDAPEGDQLEKIARAFASAPSNVACFQGVLDYYNPNANWLARCFTLEYSGWFRIVMPALERLGLILPLGGTTMFIRRKVLQDIGGWDAHNVTEDADLGVRLARAGYDTRMLPSTTFEEANCRPWPWVKQRSRWLKGFMLTYMVHMRDPARTLNDIGWRKFIGLQAFFLGTLGQFILAPVLWSYWAWWLGLGHPTADIVSAATLNVMIGFMICCEALSVTLGFAAAFACRRPKLAIWAFSLLFYYPLGTIAVFKSLYELIQRPFYWDKTQHGIHSDLPQKTAPHVALTSVTAAVRAPLHPASDG
ncbi:glycosyltransferase [Epibacterium sp. SM1969]|uniref:Glycosyltransferase n=1 Tax=Tritonibacter aquimaris TaxID=2663379 RepID=A0A844AUN4_9RHOB|nr:glycosyltransferase [Tritonibacter aquimaris]MQY43148.1 glycosyltransferase [Tritonibacter aquimaris]